MWCEMCVKFFLTHVVACGIMYLVDKKVGKVNIAGWSSPVARWAHNPKVGGSNPPPATTLSHKRDVGTPVIVLVTGVLLFAGFVKSLCLYPLPYPFDHLFDH